MATKKALLCWLPADAEPADVSKIGQALARVGLDVSASQWVDALDDMGWLGLVSALAEGDGPEVLVVAGRRSDLEMPSVRYGLSLASAVVGAGQGRGVTRLLLGLDFEPDVDDLPTLLRAFRPLTATLPTWAAKVVAAMHRKSGAPEDDFRLNVIALPGLGQWFEVGPRAGVWEGALFGVSGEGKITHCGVGAAGELPSTSTLEFPTRGIELEVAGVACTAWSVQNRIGESESFYVRVDGHPEKVLFGGHSGTDRAEVTVIDLA